MSLLDSAHRVKLLGVAFYKAPSEVSSGDFPRLIQEQKLMALNLQDKQAIVAEVSEVAKGALSAVVADSRGVTVDK